MLKFIYQIKRKLYVEYHFASELFNFWKKLRQYNASIDTDCDIQKMQYTISREVHTIEKGLSMRNPRKGFGQSKVKNIIGRLKIYYSLYHNQDNVFLIYPLSIIEKYISHTTGQSVNIDDIKSDFDDLLKSMNLQHMSLEENAGVRIENKVNILSKCNSSFASLLESRHSIRYFSNEPISTEVIEKALSMAQRTPSACNRQGWLTHVYFGEKSVNLVKWQGGSRGFEDEIRCSILVTANLKAFLYYEVHQAYIDGGLYAMNLINALHSLGLGTIPLSCGFLNRKIEKLHDFGIPTNEVPILIIGIGNLPEEFKVAVSERKPITITNTFHL